MAKLDKSKPYGEVFGGNHLSHRYEQEGKLFDAQGEEMVVKAAAPQQQQEQAAPKKTTPKKTTASGKGKGSVVEGAANAKPVKNADQVNAAMQDG